MGVQILPWEEAILRGKEAFHCKVQGHSAVICAKTAEPLELPFELWAPMGPIGNHVLDGNSRVLRDVAMTTNFWLSVGYNFGFVTASDMLFHSRGGFSGSSYPMKT